MNWLSKYGVNGFTATSQNFSQLDVQQDLLGSLFLPVYSQDSYISTSDFKVKMISIFHLSVYDLCLVFVSGLSD